MIEWPFDISQIPVVLPKYQFVNIWSKFELRKNHLVKNTKVYQNNLYGVIAQINRSSTIDLIHLIIVRHDRKPIHDWRHLQRIKNELTDPEFEAIEIYPTKRREFSINSHYHLWVTADKSFHWGFGFSDRFVVDGSTPTTKQRPFEYGFKPKNTIPANKVHIIN